MQKLPLLLKLILSIVDFFVFICIAFKIWSRELLISYTIIIKSSTRIFRNMDYILSING